MATSTVTAAIQLAEIAIPGIEALVKDFQALLGKHPAMTPEQLAAFLVSTAQSIHTENADTVAEIAADQANPGPVVVSPTGA